jgi:hypothetical protein
MTSLGEPGFLPLEETKFVLTAEAETVNRE